MLLTLLLGVAHTSDELGEARLLAGCGIVFDDTALRCLVDCLVGGAKLFASFLNLTGAHELAYLLDRLLHGAVASNIKYALAQACAIGLFC